MVALFFLLGHFRAFKSSPVSPLPPPPFLLSAYPKMPDPTPPLTPPASSSDNEECSSSPFSKREYLLAQMKQKDSIIESLLKQVRLHVLPKPSRRPLTVRLFLVAQSISRYSSFD